MGEKRKPAYTFLLRNHSKPRGIKVELFRSALWDSWAAHCAGSTRFRVRVDGKWWPEKGPVFLTKTEVKNAIFRGIK